MDRDVHAAQNMVEIVEMLLEKKTYSTCGTQ